MSEEKKLEIRSLIISLWDTYSDKSALAKHIEQGYIFGEYANNEHYLIDEILALVNKVQSDLNMINSYKAGTLIEFHATYDEQGYKITDDTYFSYINDEQMLDDLSLTAEILALIN